MSFCLHAQSAGFAHTANTAQKHSTILSKRKALRHLGSANSRCRVKASAALAAESVSQDVVLEPALRRTTAILDVPNPKSPTGTTKVYILAMSHVSAVSCDQVRQLIRAVRPDTVMVELCKDRVGLLATEPPAGERQWHAPAVRISGIPEKVGFPEDSDLLPRLICTPGRPLSITDIEDDTRALLATGLFRTVRPVAIPSTEQDAPLFIINPNTEEGSEARVRVDTVPPFNALEFRCEARPLPPVTSFNLRVDSNASDAGAELTGPQIAELESTIRKDANRENANTVEVLMEARARILEAAESPVPVYVEFGNVEGGAVEAVLQLQRDEDYMSGLEPSAKYGEGFGIEAMKPMEQGEGITVGLTSKLPAEIVDRLKRQARRAAGIEEEEGDAAEGEQGGQAPRKNVLPRDVLRGRGRTQWREWTWREKATAADEDPASQPLKDLVATTLTKWYGKLQGKSGDTVGVEAGDAWRIAMEEAVQCGAAQIILGDRPAFVTQRRLAQGLWDALSPRVLIGFLAFNAAIFAGGFKVIDNSTAYQLMGLALAGTALGLLPVALPFWELYRFSEMNADEIEKAVEVPEPVESDLRSPLKLFGEDALLDWPGAMESIISERDTYMAKALAAAATGKDGQVPAFVMEEQDDFTVLRYMMADGAPNKAAPTGKGDAAYQPLGDAQAVVAVIGSAHVRGMCREWDKALQDKSVEKVLVS